MSNFKQNYKNVAASNFINEDDYVLVCSHRPDNGGSKKLWNVDAYTPEDIQPSPYPTP